MIKNKIYIVILFTALGFIKNLQAQTLETLAKVSMIEKMTRYIDWEENSIGDYFIIAVLGNSPFNGEFEEMVKTVKTIKNKPIKVIYSKTYTDLECNLLFICASEKENSQNILAHFSNQNVLLISGEKGFSPKDVHFNLIFTKDGKPSFDVYTEAIKKSRLKVNIRLINMGTIKN